jgi:hypothetical protein
MTTEEREHVRRVGHLVDRGAQLDLARLEARVIYAARASKAKRG